MSFRGHISKVDFYRTYWSIGEPMIGSWSRCTKGRCLIRFFDAPVEQNCGFHFEQKDKNIQQAGFPDGHPL
jgi:hypothetical protein